MKHVNLIQIVILNPIFYCILQAFKAKKHHPYLKIKCQGHQTKITIHIYLLIQQSIQNRIINDRRHSDKMWYEEQQIIIWKFIHIHSKVIEYIDEIEREPTKSENCYHQHQHLIRWRFLFQHLFAIIFLLRIFTFRNFLLVVFLLISFVYFDIV